MNPIVETPTKQNDQHPLFYHSQSIFCFALLSSNVYGYNVRVSPSGSMLQRLMYDAAIHFVDHLPSNQGKGGEGVFWFLDFHGSRLNPLALTHAIRNNVMPFLLPSKCSEFGQPNDKAANMSLSALIGQTAQKQNLMTTSTYTIEQAITTFKKGHQEWVERELDRLRYERRNCSTSGFKSTGIHPFYFDCNGWKDAREKEGIVQRLLESKLRQEGVNLAETFWVTRVREDADLDCLTEDEVKLLLNEPRPPNFPSNQRSILYFQADTIMVTLLAKYMGRKDRDKSVAPEPTTELERIASKLFFFDKGSNRPPMNTKTEAQLRLEQDKALLQVLEIGSVAHLRRTDTDMPSPRLSVFRQTRDEYVVLGENANMPQSIDAVLREYTVFTLEKTLTREEQRRQQTHQRKLRKEQASSLQETAKSEALAKRQEAIDEVFDEVFAELDNPPSKIQRQKIQAAIELPRRYDIEIQDPSNPSETKTMDVSLIGFNAHAADALAKALVMDLLQKKKDDARRTKERKGKRGYKITTKRSQTGTALALSYHKENEEEKLAAAKKVSKDATEKIASLKKLLATLEEGMEKQSSEYWIPEHAKGAQLTAFAKLFNTFSSKDNVATKRSNLEALNITQVAFDDKIKDLKEDIQNKVEELLASREEEDGLQTSIDRYRDLIGDDCDVDDDDDDDDDDDV